MHVLFTSFVFTTPAHARSTIPTWWIPKALCIHRHESVDWHRTTDWRGYPSEDRGGLQIAVGTWNSLAPATYPRNPASASPRQQLTVAYRIWVANGHRFGGNQWYYSAAACRVA
jgi:hypothetical protein